MEYVVADGMVGSAHRQQGRKKGHPRRKGAGGTREEIESRFWSKVIKGDLCWEWQPRYGVPGGYGLFGYQKDGARTTTLAHRFSYEMFVGEIPSGMCVCHKCDNPRCVRPDHLFVGTHQDNMRDRKEKGRFAGCGGAIERKITEKDVREIRQAKVTFGTISQLARKFNVSRITVRQIIARTSHKSVI